MLARLKFDISTLVDEMLDRLPDDIWDDASKTFVDPCMAGGQFVAEIERRLRQRGASDEDIRRRVHGFCDDRISMNYAVNRYRLVGTYALADFISISGSYDVIIGNPPFKNSNEKGGKSSKWRRYVDHAWSLIPGNGYLCMITPNVPVGSKDLGNLFTQHRCHWIMDDIRRYFGNVGSNFSAWLLQKAPSNGRTLLVSHGLEIDIRDGKLPKNPQFKSLMHRLLAGRQTFAAVSNRVAYHTDISKADTGNRLSTIPGSGYDVRLRRTSGDTEFIYAKQEPDDYRETKVVFTFSGYPHFRIHTGDDPCGSIAFQSGHIVVNSREQGENLIGLYESKLYRFMQKQLSSGGMRGINIYSLPMLDINRVWSDQELYRQFEVSKQEIDEIERNLSVL